MGNLINNIYICVNNITLFHFDYILSSTLDIHEPINKKIIINVTTQNGSIIIFN